MSHLYQVVGKKAVGSETALGWVVLRKQLLHHLFALSERCEDAARYDQLHVVNDMHGQQSLPGLITV